MNYNTDINIIGGIPDFYLIYEVLPKIYRQDSELYRTFVVENEFNFRTEVSRQRFLRAIKSAFVNPNLLINDIISALLCHLSSDEKSKALLIFWAFSMNNTLFYQMNRDVFFKNLYRGRVDLPTTDVAAYLYNLVGHETENNERWSEYTIQKIASKYLTILKKLSFVEGKQKKSFSFVRVSDELLACFVHLACLRTGFNPNFLEDDFSQFSFVPQESMIERLKQIGKKGWIKMNFTGSALNVDGVYDANNIIDGIFG